uniref:Uncharacterized protein n=1 Tax=Clytia hemisphaerica TaxID=252671 RepID=A0A7M5V6T3_9CNID
KNLQPSQHESLTIETSSPEKYESGKPATLQWNVTYIGDKNLHSMRLDVYLQDNGTRILVGTHAGVEKPFRDDFDTEISPASNSISVNVTIKELKSGDFYNFTLDAVEQRKHRHLKSSTDRKRRLSYLTSKVRISDTQQFDCKH